jgi:hypothetical protein
VLERLDIGRSLLLAASLSVATAACVQIGAVPIQSLDPVPTAHAIEPPRATGRTLEVPASVDATGSSDASASLQRFVDSIPNGTTIEFPSDGVYRMDDGLILRNRQDLVFDGNGATLRANGSAARPMDSLFALMTGNDRITIRDFLLIGNNPYAGTKDAFQGGQEHLAGAYVGASTNVLITDVEMRDFPGDCVHIGADPTGTWSSGIVFQDSICTGPGRHGVSLIAAEDITVHRVVFDEIGYMVVDIEPDQPNEGARSFLFAENTIGSYGLTDQKIGWVVSAYGGAEGAPVHDVWIVNNTITGSPDPGFDGIPLGMAVIVDGRLGPRSGWVIRDNTSTITASRTVHGAPVYIRDTEGVVVAGNRQPMRRGEYGRFPGSTEVIYQDNDTGD